MITRNRKESEEKIRKIKNQGEETISKCKTEY
jgi:hypothetical protein